MLYTNNQILERDGLMKRTYFKSWKKRLWLPKCFDASNERLDFEKDQLRTSELKKDLDFDFEPNQVQVKSTGLGLDLGQVLRFQTKGQCRLRTKSGRLRTRSGQLGSGGLGPRSGRGGQEAQT